MRSIHVFTLADVPVSVSPWYGLLLLFSFSGRNLHEGLSLVAAITLSLLVHEFGHALVAKRYGLGPKVLLHGFGGLTSHAKPTWDRQEALIVAAGPGAGLLLGLVSLVVRLLWGNSAPPPADVFLGSLIFINFFWSFFNLLPIWPMDGGQLFRLGMLRLLRPVVAERVVHGVALVLIVGAGIVMYMFAGGGLMMMLFFMMGMENAQALQSGGTPMARHESPAVKQLMMAAEEAFAHGDDREAVRLCHQLRSFTFITPGTMVRTWAVLGVSTTRLGKYDEALSYLKRAPDRADVVEARAQCYFQLRRFDDLTALTRDKAFQKLPVDTQRAISTALADATGGGGAAPSI